MMFQKATISSLPQAKSGTAIGSRRDFIAGAAASPLLSVPTAEAIAWSAEAVGDEIMISARLPDVMRGVAAFIEKGWTLRGTMEMLRFSLLNPIT
jgi:hypothetical protein